MKPVFSRVSSAGFLSAVAVLSALALFAGCGSSGPATGRVDIRVTDSPDPSITAIYITASKIEVNQATGEGETGWREILTDVPAFDLLRVVGREESLGVADLAAGQYNQVRMHVVKVEVTRDGDVIEAEVPSGIIRLVRPFTVSEDEETVLTFDFDAERSLVATAGGQRYQFRPTVHLMVRKGSEPFRPADSR